MVQFKSNINTFALAFIALASVIQAQSTPSSTPRPRACPSNSLTGAVGDGKGGRKIGIVIDESLSMEDNDPTNVRIVAAKALDESLISSAEATGDKKADLVTVAGFHSSPDLLYPLGDPEGAIPIIDAISSSKWGTFIGGGVKAATDELTQDGSGTTANRTGIVVLTDGEDNSSGLSGVQGTINAITRAGSLGIRVSFGFLSVDSSNQDPRILSAILATGGAFTSFTSAISQESFISQVLLQGLTGIDASGNSTVLFPGLTTSASLSQTAANKFSYTATAGEKFNFTITAIDDISLKATLKDVKSGAELESGTTNSTGVAVIVYTAKTDLDVELEVTAAGANKSGIFSVGLQSSLGPCVSSNTTTPSNSTPTSPPVQYTGGAATAGLFGGAGSGVVFSMLGFLGAALLL